MTARTVARIPGSLWADPAFASLDATAQWLYLLLITQPELAPDGTIPLRARRWSLLAADATPEMVRDALGRLAAAGLVQVDHAQDEVRVPGAAAPPRARRPTPPRPAAVAPPARIELVQPHARPGKRPRLTRRRLARIRLAVYAAAGYRCQECGAHFPPPDGYDGWFALGRRFPSRRGPSYPDVWYDLELDHVYPHSRGGRFELANLQALCSGCNSRKGAKI